MANKYNISSEYNLNRDIKILQASKRRTLEPVHTPVPAAVFEVNGSKDVAGKDGYVWVHEFGLNQSPAQALAGSLSVQAGDWVWVLKDPKEPAHWKIVGYFTGNLDPGVYSQVIRHLVGEHAENHQYPSETDPGNDPVLVYQPALQMLKTIGDGTTLTASVQNLIYHVNKVRRFFSGSTVDLTANVPAAGFTRKVLVYLDITTNTIKTVNGGLVATGGAIPAPYPELPANAKPSAYVELSSGQTSITTATDIEDSRDLLNIESQRPPIAMPTAESQILMSNASLAWIAVFPVVGEDGNIVTSEGKIIHGS